MGITGRLLRYGGSGCLFRAFNNPLILVWRTICIHLYWSDSRVKFISFDQANGLVS